MTTNIRRAAALVLTACLGLSWAAPQTVQAQAFGNRNLGGALSGGTRSAFGSGGGSNAFGQSGGAIQGNPGERLQNLGSTEITGSERYVRGNRTAGQFVGSDSADSGFIGALTGGTTGGTMGFGGIGGRTGFGGQGGFGGIGGLGGFGGQGMFGNTGGRNAGRFGNNMRGFNSNRQINVRTRMTIGFPVPERMPPVAREQQIGKILNSGRIVTRGNLTIEIDQGTATLRGRVATDADREVALQLAKLEPGVETVRDELEVASPEAP